MKTTLATLLCSLALTLSAFAADHEKGPEPLKISHGAQVELSDYLVPGKTTVFDFSSEYCPPCRRISPKLDELHKTRSDIAVVKIDINRAGIKQIDWKSPVAQQYSLQSIPQFKVFGPNGKLIAEGDDASEMVESWLK
jgi:thioredoxin